jgi:hypothetical protein
MSPPAEKEILITYVGGEAVFSPVHSKYSGRGKFMPLPLKSKLLETPESLVTDDIKMFPL